MKLINEKTGEVCEFKIHKFVGKTKDGKMFAPVKDGEELENWKPCHDIEEFKDGDSTLFTIDWKGEAVRTECGDFYYDYDISFEDIKRLYETIKKRMEAK